VALFTGLAPRVRSIGVQILRTPLIVAHRGASRAEPPGNTVAAFERAKDLGADWVELDVRATADGARVVHHDAELADGRAICELGLEELPSVVPRFEVALAACEGMGVNVEIKNSSLDPDFDPTCAVADSVVEVLQHADRDRVLVTSFDLATIDRVRALDPTLPTGLLAFDLNEPASVIDAAVAGGHRAINPWDPFVDADLMRLARAAGLDVNVWTVNDVARMRQLIELGVDAIITDVPDVLARLLR
jgi:glycerophosphoryl diester phosphodiesterase